MPQNMKLQIKGVEMVDWDSTVNWFLEHGIRILIILAIYLAVYLIMRKTVPAAIG